MMKHLIYLGLGSNLGNRRENLAHALQMLKPEVKLIQVSPIYETTPWGYLNQPTFLNCAAEAKTDLSPLKLLNKLKWIEKELGRHATFLNGPRIIDIDILLYNQRVMTSDKITIPHPRMLERAFVIVPLADIAGEVHHPVTGKSINDTLEGMDISGVTQYDKKEEI